MAVAIRLKREGTKDKPFYRIVVADQRKRRDGRFIESLGTYNPMLKGDAVNFNIDLAKTDDWISKGARPSETVSSLIKKARKTAVEA